MSNPSFSEACGFRMPFGKWRGERLDEIERKECGLRYLDWLVGQSWTGDRVQAALSAYLAEPKIALKVRAMTERNGQ